MSRTESLDIINGPDTFRTDLDWKLSLSDNLLSPISRHPAAPPTFSS